MIACSHQTSPRTALHVSRNVFHVCLTFVAVCEPQHRVLYLLSGEDVVVTVPSGGTTGHNTTTLQKYDVEDANFCLCDTWGLDNNNYKEEHKVLPALLEGWLPNNWKMEYQLRDRRPLLLANDATRCKRRVHGVLFFITAGAVHDDAEMDTIKHSFQKVSFAFGVYQSTRSLSLSLADTNFWLVSLQHGLCLVYQCLDSQAVNAVLTA